jgi:hypothetical protein
MYFPGFNRFVPLLLSLELQNKGAVAFTGRFISDKLDTLRCLRGVRMVRALVRVYLFNFQQETLKNMYFCHRRARTFDFGCL